MKSYYLIIKTSQRAWGINPAIPHEVFYSKKNAVERCKYLNDRAMNLHYEIMKVKGGDES